MERLSMRNIREILRLKFEGNLSDRQIAKSTQVSRSTISDYLRRFAISGLTWPLSTEVTDTTIDALLFPTKSANPDALRPIPDWAVVNCEMRRKGVTLFLLWQEYKAIYPEGFLYSWYCDHYREWAGKLDAVMRQEHIAGEKCFVDYCGKTLPLTDRYTGEIRQAQVFVGLMGASNYTFAEATYSQTLPDWIGSHIRMFDYFGAVPLIIVPDNLKSGVSKTCRYEPEINPSYCALATHYGVAVIPARSRKPKDKAKVENGVLIVTRWIMACLRNQVFFSLAEMNTSICELLTRLNQRQFKKIPGCRETMFRTIDFPAMRALPTQRHVFSEWKKARLGLDYHIDIGDGYYYSAPYTLIGKELDVNFSEYVVEIFYQGERVASHIRLHFGNKKQATELAHMPKEHSQMAEWTPERITNWARSVGVNTSALIEELIKRKPHPQQAFRAAVGIIRLSKQYGCDRVEAACRRAVSTKAISYTSVESILKHQLDKLPLPQDCPQSSLPQVHENIRGSGYFH